MLEESQILIGIDDAGRGPLLGPMCLAGVAIRQEIEKELINFGVKDSKLLTPKKRESLVDYIKNRALKTKFQLITPSEIDTGFGEGLNLNEVEALAAGIIINELVSGLTENQKQGARIILDCPSINTLGWKKQLMRYVKEKKLEKNILCEHKADFNHPVVSAASIIAKTTRDAEIEKIKKEIGINFGSGYPSDPSTIKFLKENATNPKYKGIFRESWSTWREAAYGKLNKFEEDLKKRAKQSRLGEY